MNRRRFLLSAGLTTAVLATGGTAMAVRGADDSGNNNGDGAESDATDVTSSTAKVTRRDLEERAELDGTLGYGESTEVSLQAQGTITALPALGSVIDRGQSIVEVDGKPIPLLFGDRPFWRQLGADADDGADIEELEANLVALGFAGSDLTVDQKWTSATTTAVKKWQESLGRDKTGVVSPGDTVVLPGAIRVAGHPTPVGGGAGGPVIEATSVTRQVTIDLPATKQSLVTVGQAVEVELPDGSVAAGKVASIGTVAISDDDSTAPGQDPATPTIEVVISLDDPAAGGTLDEAPVTVRVVTSAAQGVLAVPVDALLALAEGGYAVEIGGQLVAVETGAFADGWVEVTGDIAEGDDVVVPA